MIEFDHNDSTPELPEVREAGICASSGSACFADAPNPFQVIATMKPGKAARQCVRLSPDANTTKNDTNITVDRLREQARTLSRTR